MPEPINDPLADLLMPKEEPKVDDVTFDPKEVSDLKAVVEQMKTEKQGLLKATQEERRKRQEMKGRLDQVTTTVNSILEQRESLADSQSQAAKDEATLDGIPVEFTEDGDAFVPTDKLNSLTSKYEDEIAALKDELYATRDSQASQVEYDQAVAAMVGEKPEYAEAHRRYQASRKWISDRVTDWSKQNNVNRPLTSGEALTHVLDKDAELEFKEQFPDLDMVSITTAEDSPWHFKTMLQKTSDALNELVAAPKDSRFQRVVNKPSSLGKSANAQGGQPSLTEKLGSLSATDILKFSDAEIDALSRHLSEEEKDGIDW